MNVLTAQNIQKSFGGSEVLKDISFAISEGEVLSIIGPSGSGKSTLLRCVTLLERIDSGRIAYGDLLMADTPAGQAKAVYSEGAVLQQIRRRFGLVFQNFNLFPHFTVMRNLTEAPVRVGKKDRRAAEEQARELLAKVGLADREKAYPCELSGGQQQRVAIARALAMQPGILFFDEPTSALDPELTGDILKVIRGLAEERMTMVIVTHEMAFARDVSDRVLFMDGGVIVEQGDPAQVIEHPQSERQGWSGNVFKGGAAKSCVLRRSFSVRPPCRRRRIDGGFVLQYGRGNATIDRRPPARAGRRRQGGVLWQA